MKNSSIKSVSLSIAFVGLTTFLSILFLSSSVFAAAGGYKKATEGEDVVKNKLYPKRNRLELNLPNVGMILNQSYLTTLIVNGGANYFWDEVWGVGIDFSIGLNSDREERTCVESFYNDPDGDVGSECGGPEGLEGSSRGNYGPAYVNIREYNSIISGNVIWNPIYGKEIFFLSAVGYFDVYTTGGIGLAQTTLYPETTVLNNGKESRGVFPAAGTSGSGGSPGASADEVDSYGKAGRPLPIKESKVMLQAGVGQRFHFAKIFHFKTELRNHIVVGTPNGFDMFFTLWGGLGVRF